MIKWEGRSSGMTGDQGARSKLSRQIVIGNSTVDLARRHYRLSANLFLANRSIVCPLVATGA